MKHLSCSVRSLRAAQAQSSGREPTAGRKKGKRAVAVALLFACLSACDVIPSRDPTGERCVDVRGTTLDGSLVNIPTDLANAPTVLLIVYRREAQFDADRWRLALDQLDVRCRILLVHALPTTFGVFFAPVLRHDLAGTFGLREKPLVLPLTGTSADDLCTQTGMGNSQFAHVLVIAPNGEIVFAFEQGYAPETVERVHTVIEQHLPAEADIPQRPISG